MKNILVTGAAEGIGKTIAQRLLETSDSLVIVIDKKSTAFVDECRAKHGARFVFFKQDIADRDGLGKMLDIIASKHKIDGIINNAGEVYLEKWDQLDLKTWDRTIAVNTTGPLQIVHRLRDALRDGGAIVNIASTDGNVAAFDTVAYAASKAALISLTKSLAANLGPRRIRVNAVSPGWVATEMTKDTLPEEAAALTPLGRNTLTTEVADLVMYLLSEQSSFVNAQVIEIDGGLSTVDYILKKEAENFTDQ